jgi:predicted transcriptional regulator
MSDERIIRVSDVMRTTLHMTDGLSSVQEALETMQRLSVSSLIIERRNPDDAYGILTVQDIATRVMSLNKPMARTSVYEVMTKPALTLVASMKVKYAIRLLSRLGLTRALVTRDDELTGLVTLRDLVVGYARAGGSGE